MENYVKKLIGYAWEMGNVIRMNGFGWFKKRVWSHQRKFLWNWKWLCWRW